MDRHQMERVILKPFTEGALELIVALPETQRMVALAAAAVILSLKQPE